MNPWLSGIESEKAVAALRSICCRWSSRWRADLIPPAAALWRIEDCFMFCSFSFRERENANIVIENSSCFWLSSQSFILYSGGENPASIQSNEVSYEHSLYTFIKPIGINFVFSWNRMEVESFSNAVIYSIWEYKNRIRREKSFLKEIQFMTLSYSTFYFIQVDILFHPVLHRKSICDEFIGRIPVS